MNCWSHCTPPEFVQLQDWSDFKQSTLQRVVAKRCGDHFFDPETGKCATSLQVYSAGNHQSQELTSCGEIDVAKVRRWRQGSRIPKQKQNYQCGCCVDVVP
jgi:hypothetical protein